MGIDITYSIDTTGISDPTPSDGQITDSDFDTIASQHRSVSGSHTSYQKYILYCNYHPTGAKGFTSCDVSDSTNEINSGNDVRIFQARCSDFDSLLNVPDHSTEVDVLIHELGHTIGIGIMNSNGEDYGDDRYNCMNRVYLENTILMNGYWYIHKDWWAQRNYGL
jgi:hypothetical protein